MLPRTDYTTDFMLLAEATGRVKEREGHFFDLLKPLKRRTVPQMFYIYKQNLSSPDITRYTYQGRASLHASEIQNKGLY